MNIKKVTIFGMNLDEVLHKSCIAHFGIGDDWATLYDIESADQGKGHATELVKMAKEYYTSNGKKFGSTPALSVAMKKILIKLDVPEYT